MNGESHGGLCERRGERDLLAVGPHPSLAEPAVAEARYLNARNRAFAAWANSQPQYVIPGVLEEADRPHPVGLLEPAVAPHAATTGGGLTSCGTEPRHKLGADGNQPLVSGRPSPCSGLVVGAALTTATETGANHSQVTRARLREGV